jgi:hypothetical protein
MRCTSSLRLVSAIVFPLVGASVLFVYVLVYLIYVESGVLVLL